MKGFCLLLLSVSVFSVCAWGNNNIIKIEPFKDGKQAAFSLTIDDNFANEIHIWKRWANQYQTKFTWFVITGIVGRGNPVYGEWQDYKALKNEGHDIQSHAHFGFHGPFSPTGQVLNHFEEYSKSKSTLTYQLQVHHSEVLSLAYPNGAHFHGNSTSSAQRLYAFARDTRAGINTYDNLNLTLLLSNGDARTLNWHTIQNMISQNGWYVAHFHNLNTPSERQKASTALSLTHQNRDKIWRDTFTKVAKYMATRKNIKVVGLSEHSNTIHFQIKGAVDGRWRDQILTLSVNDNRKVRSISQGGKRLHFKEDVSLGHKRTLFDATPNGGTIQVQF